MQTHQNHSETKNISLGAKILLGIGIIFSLFSIWQTFLFTFDPTFQAPALEDGPTHTNYHVFRGAMLALGVIVAVIYGYFIAGGSLNRRNLTVWNVIFITTLFYYAGWWIPASWGYNAPHINAVIVHLVATFGVLGGQLVGRSGFKTHGSIDGFAQIKNH